MTRELPTPLPTPPPGRLVVRNRDRNKYGTAASFYLGNIASFKTTPIILPDDLRTDRPVTGLCCDCLPKSRKESLPDMNTDNGVCNILNVKPSLRNVGWLLRRFPVTTFCLQKRADLHYPDISMAVFTNNKLLEAIQKTSIVSYSQNFTNGGKELQTVQSSLVLNAKKTLQNMKACISSGFINFTGWFLLKFLSLFLRNILVHRGQIKMVCNASEKNIPMIYLPLHRSHLDYILITFVLWYYKLRAPFVAAGDNLNIPVFNMMMRGLGGFYIRRRLDKKSGEKDIIYRTLLHTYIEELLKHGEGMEFFIEGGRTRSGKANLPKGGLLSIITETCSKGLIPDAYIIPISISYDKLIDGNFNREQMGLPKMAENFCRAMKGIFSVLMGDFGSVRINFCQPFSLKEFIDFHEVTNSTNQGEGGHIVKVDSSPDLSPNMVASYPCLRQAPCNTSDTDRRMVQVLAEHVLYSAVHSTSFMSTNLVCFLLLTKHRSGTTISTMTRSMEELVQDIRHTGRDIGFCGNMKDAVHNALSLLGTNLIPVEVINSNKDNLCLKPNLKVSSVFELMYYSNPLLYVYLFESIVAVAATYVTKSNISEPDSKTEEASKEQILFTATEICKLLQQEFILVPPCKKLEDKLSEVIESFITTAVLRKEGEEENLQYDVQERQWANRLCESLSWEEEDEFCPADVPEDKYIINLHDAQICKRLRFLLCVLAPTLEAYLTTANYINLYLKTEIAEDDFIFQLNQFAKSQAKEKKLDYNESCAIDTLRNCVKSFNKLGILDLCVAGSLRLVGLSEEFDVKDRLMHYIRLLEVIKTINIKCD